ncbi:L-glutaminase [Hyphomicrobium facile]|uniref:Glutaminase n=1 Tax=Hyphomicrobium facile TaxID=51670 RepID=A0A1I7N4E3_9HYPH|nr:L-glutaminase [Hyphomicrobium facile]
MENAISSGGTIAEPEVVKATSVDAVPNPTSQVDQMLAYVYEQTRPITHGVLADYIPELSKVPADSFGIAVATTKGKLHKVGDADVEFTIQSTSKALTYCMALELVGRKEVLSRAGVEPSGDPFNAIEFSPETRRPFNPMVNAGAIAISGLLRDILGEQKAFDLVLDRFSRAAGRQLSLNESVYRSEAATGHRNRAIGHLLLSVGAMTEPVEPVLDLYFKQCSVMVTATDLARIGATIANLGVNPVTNEQVFDIDAVRDTQSVMFTCGMYDYSGGWAYEVGIPAKSGVGGGILGVVNRQIGIGTYSPRLDSNGNSVRGVASYRMMSDSLGLHSFDLTNTGSGFVSSFFTSDTAEN